jgi:hypothetical protein
VVWSTPHPDWTPQSDFTRPVTSTCVITGDEVVILDPLAPSPDCDEAWARLDAAPPTIAVVLKPDGQPIHERAAYERALTLAPWRG